MLQVEDRWVITPLSGRRVHLSVTFELRWLKDTFWKSVVESKARSEIVDFFHFATEHMKIRLEESIQKTSRKVKGFVVPKSLMEQVFETLNKKKRDFFEALTWLMILAVIAWKILVRNRYLECPLFLNTQHCFRLNRRSSPFSTYSSLLQ
jgi:hypothetical protein